MLLEDLILELIKLELLLLEILEGARDELDGLDEELDGLDEELDGIEEELEGLLLLDGVLDVAPSQAPSPVHACSHARPVPGEYTSLIKPHQPHSLH